MPLHRTPLSRAKLVLAIARDDRGENSIMQVVSIAVSAILIVAGLMAAPGLINAARDNNARDDLDNIAYVQEYAHANTGTYVTVPMVNGQPDLSELNASVGGDDPRLKLNLSTNSFVITGNERTWAAIVVSSSGNSFIRTSSSTRAYQSGRSLASDSDAISGEAIPVGIPSSVWVSGTKSNPSISINNLPRSVSGWSQTTGIWGAVNPPSLFQHSAIPNHGMVWTNENTVVQSEGFKMSGVITFGSDPTTHGGFVVSNSTDNFQIMMDRRNSSGVASALQIRKNYSSTVGQYESIARDVSIDAGVPYRFTVSVKGVNLDISVVDTVTGTEKIRVNYPVSISGFSDITKVGVYGFNEMKVENFVVY